MGNEHVLSEDRRVHLQKTIADEQTLAGLEGIKYSLQRQGEWTEMVGEWTRRKVAIIKNRKTKGPWK